MNNNIYAKVLAHTLNEKNNQELITLECRYHRFILPEVNTYRMISKNSASSRGIPIQKRIEEVETNPAFPVEWGKNCKGMKAVEMLSEEDKKKAEEIWRKSLQSSISYAKELMNLGVHKQVVNRILEPYLWQTSVFTGMRKWFEHIFEQRIHPDAQPEFRELAIKMKEAIENSKPNMMDLHLPYITEEEKKIYKNSYLAKASVARCARVSYTPFDESKINIEKDVELFNKLISAKPPHLSPLEHVAIIDGSSYTRTYYNLDGFVSLRWIVESVLDVDIPFDATLDTLEEGYKWSMD